VIGLLKERAGEPTEGPLRCCRALYGGMAFICCNRLGPATVEHSYAGRGVVSSRSGDPVEDEASFRDLSSGSADDVAYETYR
jgi:hypothetical protein